MGWAMVLNKRKRWAKVGAGVAIAIAGTWAGVEVAIMREYKLAAAAGLPTDPVTIRPYEDDGGTAELYREAFLARKEDPIALREALSVFAKTVSSDEAVANKQRFEPLKPYLEKFTSATLQPDLDFGRDYKEGITMLLPEYADMYTFARIQGAVALVAEHESDREQALMRLRSIAGCARHLGQEPIMIARMVQAKIEKVFFDYAGQIALEPEERLDLIKELGPLPSTRRDFGTQFAILNKEFEVYSSHASMWKLYTDLGLKEGDDSNPSWKYFAIRTPLLNRLIQLESIRERRLSATSLPHQPETVEEFNALIASADRQSKAWGPYGNTLDSFFGEVPYRNSYLEMVTRRKLALGLKESSPPKDSWGNDVGYFCGRNAYYLDSMGANGKEDPLDSEYSDDISVRIPLSSLPQTRASSKR